MKKVTTKLKSIKENCGWIPEAKMVFSLGSIDYITTGADTVDPGLLKSYKQFQADLAERGIDLVIMAFPTVASIYTYTLIDGVEATDEIDPGYTKMMLELLDNDIEVVDALDAMRAAANEDILVHWPNDGHTGPKGRQIAAAAVADRLQRYDFARDLRAQNRQHLTYGETSWTGAKTGWSQYLLNARQKWVTTKGSHSESSNIPSISADTGKNVP